MKKFTPLLLLLPLCLLAADAWQSKPYTDWSDKDIQKIETNSAWSKQVPVSLGETGGTAGKGGRRGTPSELDGGPSGSGISNGGNANNKAGLQDVGGGVGSGGNTITLTVSWRTSLPLRQAVAKEKYGSEAETSTDAKKMIQEDQKFYGIMVSGLPARVLRANEKMKDMMLKSTSLVVKGKDPIMPSDVQTGGNEQRAVILFLFPKTSPLSLDDKDVEFSTKLGTVAVRQKFHLKDMVFNGKLEL